MSSSQTVFLLTALLVACDPKDNEEPDNTSNPDDTGCVCEELIEASEDCPTDGESVLGTEVAATPLVFPGLHLDVSLLPEGEFIVEDQATWDSYFPTVSPEKSGVDFNTQVAVLSSWSVSSTCSDFDVETSVVDADDGSGIHVEFSYSSPDAALNYGTGCAVCDMYVMGIKGFAIDRGDALPSVCFRTYSGCE